VRDGTCYVEPFVIEDEGHAEWLRFYRCDPVVSRVFACICAYVPNICIIYPNVSTYLSVVLYCRFRFPLVSRHPCCLLRKMKVMIQKALLEVA